MEKREMTRRFEDKVAIVTGAGGGIGREAALQLGQQGAKVVIADFDAKGGECTADMIRQTGGEARFVVTDVTKAADCQHLVEDCVQTYGRLDLAFNNAGIMASDFRPLGEEDEAAFDRIIAVNLKGVFLCLKYEIEAMLKIGGGAVVNTASLAGLTGMAMIGSYCASKHGVIGLTRSVALDYAKQGIRVNALCPGTTDTRMWQAVKDMVDVTTVNPMGRAGSAAEVASTAVYLLSPEAAFITGAAFSVDGGCMAQ
jgi:NAD(P)-dependent dehydrogenase (short-subunit alcohol dehydrogenase family)